MFEIPQVAVLGVEVDARIRRARRGLVVDLHPRVQGKTILDLERQVGGAGLQPRADDGINLPVAIPIGQIQLALEDVRIQKHVRMQAGQRAQHIFGAEIVVVLDVDGGEAALGDFHFHRRVGEFLRRQADGDRDESAFAIRHLQAAERGADIREGDIGAEGAGRVGQGGADIFRRQNGVAGDEIFFHREFRAGVGGGIGGRRVGRLRPGGRSEQGLQQRQQQEKGGGALEIVFRHILLPPGAGRHAETPLEHDVEQSQMLVAALMGDTDDLGAGIQQQLAGALQPQLGLALAQRHAKFGAEQPAQVPLAAIKLPGQLLQRTRRQLRVGHGGKKPLKPVLQSQAGLGVGHWHLQNGGNRLGPELQQRGAHGQGLPLGLGDEVGKFFADQISGIKGDDRRGDFFADLLQLVAFRDRDEAVEKLRVHAIIFEFQRAKLAGAQHQMGSLGDHKTIARLEFARTARGQPVTHAVGHAHDGPAILRRIPFAGRTEGDLLQYQMSLVSHQRRHNDQAL